jgi:glycerophosphoryl diester phosphodiesterase
MSDSTIDSPTLIAHRGFAARFPENTLEAFQRAVAAGADGVECDVRQCATGEAVVIHDADVDRVTDGRGRVADLSLSELRDLDVLGSGEPIPTLPEVFETVPPGVTLHVELKERDPIPAVVAAADDDPHDVVVSAFDRDALDRVRTLDGPPTALLFAADADSNLERAADLDCAYVHPHVSLCLESDLVDRAHAAGFGVNVWTLGPPANEVGGPGSETGWVVSDPDAIERLRAQGVDGLIADAPL